MTNVADHRGRVARVVVPDAAGRGDARARAALGGAGRRQHEGPDG